MAYVYGIDQEPGIAAVLTPGPPRRAPAARKGKGPRAAWPPAGPVKLLAREAQPPDLSLYVALPLGTEPPARAMTGIFLPQGFRPQPQVDVVLYLHGFKVPALTISRYWRPSLYPNHGLREGLNASRKNAVLVAPTLGPHSQAGRLVRPGGLDGYLARVLAALAAHGPFTGGAPALGSLVLSCHSGGGWPMRQLAFSGDQAAARIRECWGFDCLYNRGDETEWARWARERPGAKLYVHYGSGNTARRSEALRGQGVPNVVVEGDVRLAHDKVPITHWQERLKAADFLQAI